MMRRHIGLAAALAALLLAGHARAEDSPRQKQSEALFLEGTVHHDAGRRSEALDRFEKAYALFPTANTLFAIAREEQLLGRSLEALHHYREVVKNALLTEKWARLAKERIAELEPRFGKVLLKGPAGMTVSVAGKALRLPIEEPIDVDPGPLSLKGERDGLEYAASASAEAGKVTTLDFKPTSPSSTPIVEPPPVIPSSGPSSARWLLPVGRGVVGLTGLVLGGVFIEKGNDNVDELRSAVARSECAGGSTAAPCARAKGLQDDVDSAATWRTVSFITGGVFVAAAGVTSYFFARPSDAGGRASVRPLVSPSLAGAEATFRF